MNESEKIEKIKDLVLSSFLESGERITERNYYIGLYNGLEWAQATIEDRDPVFKDVNQ